MAVIPRVGVQPGHRLEPGDVVPDATQETGKTTYTVEVIRREGRATEIFSGVPAVEVTRPQGAVNNIGSGPRLPETPYEGQVWILT